MVSISPVNANSPPGGLTHTHTHTLSLSLLATTQERCTEYKIESPAYKDGAPCPYEDGYLSCLESQYCLCNKPIYDEVEETGESPGQPPRI